MCNLKKIDDGNMKGYIKEISGHLSETILSDNHWEMNTLCPKNFAGASIDFTKPWGVLMELAKALLEFAEQGPFGHSLSG
jgi:hypothetical protein